MLFYCILQNNSRISESEEYKFKTVTDLDEKIE